MNLLEIRTNLIKDTGHYELVTDAENDDYTDNGADRFIKEGQKLLEQLCPPPIVSREQTVKVQQGQYLVYIPEIRALEYVYLYDMDGNRYDIEKYDYKDLVDMYEECFDQVDEAQPEYISRLPIMNQAYVSLEHSSWYVSHDAEEVEFETTLPGPFSGISELDNDSHWDTIGEKIKHTVYTKYTGEGLARLPDIIYYSIRSFAICLFPETFSGEMTVTIDATLSEKMRMTAVLAYISEEDDGIYIDLSSISETIDMDAILAAFNGSMYEILETGETAITFDKGMYNALILFARPLAEDDELLWSDDILEESVVINSVFSEYNERSANIVVMPPADKTYKIKAIGTVHDREFVNDEDATWWSSNHPELLMLAARVHMEIALHRNESGAQALRDQIQQRVMEIAAHLTYEKVSGKHDKAVMNG